MSREETLKRPEESVEDLELPEEESEEIRGGLKENPSIFKSSKIIDKTTPPG